MGTHTPPGVIVGQNSRTPWNLHAALGERGDPKLTENTFQLPGQMEAQNRNGVQGKERK